MAHHFVDPQRLRAETELRESEEKYRSLVDNITDIIFTIDHTLTITFTNRVLEGFTYDQVVGQNALSFIPPEDHERVSHIYASVFATGVPARHEIEAPGGDGQMLWFSTSVSPIFRDGKVVGLTLVVRDITEHKRAEEALHAQREKLIVSAKMSSLGEMAGGLAHEINNPLAIIYGLAMQTKRLSDKGALEPKKLTDNLTMIVATTERIAKIIKGMKSFSRSSEQDALMPVKVQQIIDDTLELCKERFRLSSIDLRISCEPDAVINCRPSQIAQVLMNLLGNAFDAVVDLPDKWVAIDARVVDQRVRIEVTDSGCGIPAALVDKIMQPFFTTKEVGKGTGLGLSISKGLIESHDGTFAYDKTCSNTRFVIDLPAAIPSTPVEVDRSVLT